MKIKPTIIMYICILILSLSASAKSDLKIIGKHASTQKIINDYKFNNDPEVSNLYIHNINGFIEVEGYHGDTVKVEIEKTISSKTESGLQEGLNDTQFIVKNHENEMHMYLKTPYSNLDLKKSGLRFSENNSGSKYKYIMNYKVMVPHNSSISVSTVNSGYILINNIQANEIRARHVNGSIKLTKVSGMMDISTVNGDVDLDYIDDNIRESKFKTVNGDFLISFNELPSLDIRYESLNGHLYTDFDPKDVSTVVQKQKIDTKKGIKYKLKSGKRVQIGDGDINFKFNTINGNITIAQKD